MAIQDASIKANVSSVTCKKYYYRYLYDLNHEIPVPHNNVPGYRKPYTHEQVTELIGYIFYDNTSLAAASVKAKVAAEKAATIKANMNGKTAIKYYLKYVKDPNDRLTITKEKQQEL
ncbi:hypothetical protein K501DRAFT_265787 [Backusella circina FSU 941]|nr:hypothetical protein K501DRAFT_265787 [Backusella circina FSU 941]